MNFEDYKEKAKKTAIYPKKSGIFYTALGLAGEAGEIANKVKKIIRDDNNSISLERRTELINELGDVLWYVAMMCDELYVDMDDVARWNLEKLEKRQKENKLKGEGDKR
jgi:NTP pyrophosphatase (non-canonical NTP hydrolase)